MAVVASTWLPVLLVCLPRTIYLLLGDMIYGPGCSYVIAGPSCLLAEDNLFAPGRHDLLWPWLLLRDCRSFLSACRGQSICSWATWSPVALVAPMWLPVLLVCLPRTIYLLLGDMISYGPGCSYVIAGPSCLLAEDNLFAPRRHDLLWPWLLLRDCRSFLSACRGQSICSWATGKLF